VREEHKLKDLKNLALKGVSRWLQPHSVISMMGRLYSPAIRITRSYMPL